LNHFEKKNREPFVPSAKLTGEMNGKFMSLGMFLTIL
jgi:hypothetical protein